MKIDGIQNINNLINIDNTSNKNDLVREEIKLALLEEMGSAVTYEESSLEDKLLVYDLISIKNLSEESENIYGQLKEIIKETIGEQSKHLELLKQDDGVNKDKNMMDKNIIEENKTDGGKTAKAEIDRFQTDRSQTDKVKADETDVFKSKASLTRELGLPKGSLDVEYASERIVDFVKMTVDEDKGKLNTLVKAVEEIFNEIEKTLERLPEISKKTYDRIMEKLDNLITIEKSIKEPENIKAELKRMIEDIVTEQSKTYEVLKKAETVKGDKAGIRDETIMGKGKELMFLEVRLGIKASSERIVYFVRAASDGDKEKLDNLAKEIEKVFKSLEKALGQLPDISKKTYKKIMEELYDEEELEQMMYQQSGIFAQFMNMYEAVKDNIRHNRWGMKPYIAIGIACIIFYYLLKSLK